MSITSAISSANLKTSGTGEVDSQREPRSELMDIRELAFALGIGKTKAYDLLNRGQLPVRPLRVGEAWRFSRREVERFCHGDFDGGQPLP